MCYYALCIYEYNRIMVPCVSLSIALKMIDCETIFKNFTNFIEFNLFKYTTKSGDNVTDTKNVLSIIRKMSTV